KATARGVGRWSCRTATPARSRRAEAIAAVEDVAQRGVYLDQQGEGTGGELHGNLWVSRQEGRHRHGARRVLDAVVRSDRRCHPCFLLAVEPLAVGLGVFQVAY